MQGSTLTTYKVMAVWMMRCRLLLQKLTGHISEVGNQNKLNFGLVWFPYGPRMCANFQRNLRGWRFFLLIWYGMTLLACCLLLAAVISVSLILFHGYSYFYTVHFCCLLLHVHLQCQCWFQVISYDCTLKTVSILLEVFNK